MEHRGRHQSRTQSALSQIALPPGVTIRAWTETDFTGIQTLSALEGWSTPSDRPIDALNAWRHSWPTLVAVENAEMIGFCRALTDGHVTTYMALPEFWRSCYFDHDLRLSVEASTSSQCETEWRYSHHTRVLMGRQGLPAYPEWRLPTP